VRSDSPRGVSQSTLASSGGRGPLAILAATAIFLARLRFSYLTYAHHKPICVSCTECLYFVRLHISSVSQVGYRGYGRGYGRQISGGRGLGPNLSPFCRWSPGTPSRQWTEAGYPSTGPFQPAPMMGQYANFPYQYVPPFQPAQAVPEIIQQQPASYWQSPYSQLQGQYACGPGMCVGVGYGQGMGMRYRWGIPSVQAGYPY